MSSHNYDVVLLGATGYTGRLITRYLASHPQFLDGRFSFALAGRSTSKLNTLVQEFSLPERVAILQVDVLDADAVQNVVKTARVIINTVGPYWRWGTPVVGACARNGVHYVDLTGETHWIGSIIAQFDYLASKTGAVIVPSCGMDSIPSDVSAYLANKTLKAHGSYNVATSVTAFGLRGGISGGTVSSGINMFEDVPASTRSQAGVDYCISPAQGRSLPAFRFLYNLQIPRDRPLFGAFFFMQPTNKRLVQRTFGLLEVQAQQEEAARSGTSSTFELTPIQKQRYGPEFAYDEFIIRRSRISAVLISVAVAMAFSLVAWFAPLRWLIKKYAPQPGEGPSEADLPNGFVKCTNHTKSTSNPPVHVKTVFKGKGDPGYYLTSIMIAESALTLVLPPISASSTANSASSSSSKSNLPSGLPSLAYKGGILTPMTALGDVLLQRLKDTGEFEFESHIVDDGVVGEGRKNI